MSKWTVEANADTIATIEHYYPVLFFPEQTCHVRNLGGLPYSIPLLLCENCEEVNYAQADGSGWNYCPNCGAKVESEKK